MKTWVLRGVALLMLAQVVYAAGWFFLLATTSADPETKPLGAAVATVYLAALALPGLCLLAAAGFLLVFAERRQKAAVTVGYAAEAIAVIGGLYSGGVLLSLSGAIALLILLAVQFLHSGRRDVAAVTT